MTDAALIAKKLLRIETAIAEIRTLGRPELIASDAFQESFILRRLQIAIQAAIDVASHIISDQKFGEPRMAREVFTILSGRGVIDVPLGERLARMVGFRNVLIHEYDDLDLDIVQRIVRERLEDLLEFASRIRETLST
jgi:uncharacterized protein YutE (UPF0331/DUF86 family)